MAAMTKIVNIRTRVAVRNVNPPICGTVKGIVMTTGDILKCLCKRAQVEEVLPDGTTVKLNMSNYYIDNGAGLDAKKNLPATGKKPVENIERFKVPVVPVEETKKQVVETKTEENDSAVEAAMNTEDVKIEADAEPAETVFVTGMCVEGDAPTDNITADVTVTENATDSVGIQTGNKPSNTDKKKKHK